jgi:XTP/dITP diphosphohydrolase
VTRPEILIATKNRGKLAEFRQIMDELGLADRVSLTSLADFPDYPDVEETGGTFEENALIKARAAAAFTGRLCAADDSGIEVEALGGAPGVLSARFAGEGATDAKNNEKLLGLLTGIPPEKRAARFVAVIALVAPGGREAIVRGECRGAIADAPRGGGGFGYDPVFFYPPLGKTYAEMSDPEKNQISHRRRAIEALCGVLPEVL